MTTLLLLLAGLFLPLYPLSIGANLLLQSGAGTGIERPGPWSRPLFKAAVILLMPLIGVWLLRLGLSRVEGDASGLITVFAVWGGATSVLYAFRLLSTRDGQIWIGQLYSSALALIWVGAAHGVAPLLPALGLAVSLLPLLFLMGSLTRRFGIARVGLYPGPRGAYAVVLGALCGGGLGSRCGALFARILRRRRSRLRRGRHQRAHVARTAQCFLAAVDLGGCQPFDRHRLWPPSR